MPLLRVHEVTECPWKLCSLVEVHTQRLQFWPLWWRRCCAALAKPWWDPELLSSDWVGPGWRRGSEASTFLTLSRSGWLDKWWQPWRTSNSWIQRLKTETVEESLERFHSICSGITGPAASLSMCACARVCASFNETLVWRLKATKVPRFHFIWKCVILGFERTASKSYQRLQMKITV